MTCTRICPSKGAINVGKINKLPYINPAYCARCEECMHACPSTAIKYSSRKRAYANYSKIKSTEIISEIVIKDITKLTNNITRIDTILSKLAQELSNEFDKGNNSQYTPEVVAIENPFVNDENKSSEDNDLLNQFSELRLNVSDIISLRLDRATDANLSVYEMNNLIDCFPPIRKISTDEMKCIGCGECMGVCPADAMYLEQPAPIHILDNCVYCGECVNACRFGVIELIEEFFKIIDNEIYFIRRNITSLRNGTFKISHNRCQVCGVCTKNCPVNALTIEDDKIIVNQDKCISCRECEHLCPVNAIKITLQS